MTQTFTPGAGKALLTVSAIDANLGVPAPLPGLPQWTASDGTVLGLEEVAGRPDQVLVLPLGPGKASVSATAGGLSASVDFEVPVPVPIPVATELKIDVEFLPV